MIEAMFSTSAFFTLIGISQEAAFWATAFVSFVLFVCLVLGAAIYWSHDDRHAPETTASTPTAIAVVVAVGVLLLAAILAGCGGSVGGSGQGDKPAGDGQSVQQTTAATITAHHADGSSTITDYGKGTP